MNHTVEFGEYDGGAEDGCKWCVWNVERSLERVSAAAVIWLAQDAIEVDLRMYLWTFGCIEDNWWRCLCLFLLQATS